MLVVLYLQPDAFDLFWTAAEATHGSTRNMEFVLKPETRRRPKLYSNGWPHRILLSYLVAVGDNFKAYFLT